MRSCDTDAVYAALRAADPDVMDRDELAVLIEQLAHHRSWCDALQVKATRRQRQLATEGRAEPPRDLLSRHGGQSSKHAKTADEREQICTALPSFEDALTAGSVSAGHLDALANTVRNLDDHTRAELLSLQADLLADAERQHVDAFERNCRDLARHLAACSQSDSDADELDQQRTRSNVRRWTDQHTGMCHTHLELDPIRDRSLWGAIDAARATLRQHDGNRRTPWQQLDVDAVIAAIGGGGRADRVPEITVLVDHDTLVNGLHPRSVCETDIGTALPVSTVRRLCCDAEVLPAVLNGNGETLDVGRSARTATRPQRRALRAMHRTCAHPDCTVPFDACRIHHVTPWLQRAGTTDIANLLPLCETHHHAVHEGGWGLTMTPERIATWARPDGCPYHTGLTVDRAPHGIEPPPQRRQPVAAS